MVMWYWSADNLFWQLSIDHNMDVQYHICKIKPRLHDLVLAEVWLPCSMSLPSLSNETKNFEIKWIVQLSRPPNGPNQLQKATSQCNFFANLIRYSDHRPKVLKRCVCILPYSISVKKVTEHFWNCRGKGCCYSSW